MHTLVAWLTAPDSLVTVTGPALVLVAGLILVPAWRTQTLRLMAIAIAFTPISLMTSWWGHAGYHVVSVFLALLLVMMLRGAARLTGNWTLDLRVDWFAVLCAVWAAALATDVVASWAQYAGEDNGYPPWFWGIGGDGLADGLFLEPVFATMALLLGQEMLRRRRPGVRVASLPRQPTVVVPSTA